jgi:hypothetical protein
VTHVQRGCLVALALVAPGACKREPPPPPAAPAPAPISAPATAEAPPAVAAKPPALAHPTRGAKLGEPTAEPEEIYDWHVLAFFLRDDLAGWKARAAAEGASTRAGLGAVSSLSRDYQRAGTGASARLLDSTMNAGLGTGLRIARQRPAERPDHWHRPVEVRGQPGLAEWTRGTGAKLTLLVGNRFVLELNAADATDTRGLEELAAAIDLERLARLAAP